MTFDRASQFNPLDGLKAAAMAARIADDAATTAMDNQQAVVDALNRRINVLNQKNLAGVASDDEVIELGQSRKLLKVEDPKRGPLQAAQADTHVAWDIARAALRAQIDYLDQNPGVVEKV